MGIVNGSLDARPDISSKRIINSSTKKRFDISRGIISSFTGYYFLAITYFVGWFYWTQVHNSIAMGPSIMISRYARTIYRTMASLDRTTNYIFTML